ncbi:PREDICTED: pickpocket protein 28-like [Polistes dominula]|uniref:Pickpocket protein 28-like n=1 Tax=Polistes dominula TaxID=743375 RepID=A0ABM1IZE5_POLDO|nr:PREDICTED: pickpocket protein 28-like [Polistes dominula]
MRVHNSRDVSRKRRKAICQCLKEKFKIYCENTTLHGFRYVTVHQSTIIESVLWLLVCIMSIIFSIILMMRLWHNYDANPTSTVISTNKPIWSIYFPAVTICNNNKVYNPHAKIFGNILSKHGINHSQSEKLFISLMKLTRPDKIDVDNLTATRALEVLGFTVDRLMYELMQPCKSMLLRCAWLGQKLNCSDIFKAVKSREGYCCAFNYHYYLDRLYGRYRKTSTRTAFKSGKGVGSVLFNQMGTTLKDVISQTTKSNFGGEIWRYDNYDLKNTSEDSDRSNIPSDELPGIGEIQKVPGSGRDVGLAVALNIEAEHYKSSNTPFAGATVLIHDPHDYPDIGIHSITVLPGHTIGVGISGTTTKSSNNLRQLPLIKRMCFFENEVSNTLYILIVKGLKNYSFQSCVSNCIYMRVHKYCGCLPFYYPNENSRTCFLTDIDCILNHRRTLSTYETSFNSECNCLPQCTDTFYDVTSESIPVQDVGYNSEITFVAFACSHNINNKNASFVYVFFRKISYIEYRTQNILSWDTLLASFGGIFGLCLGGSVISLVELLYYITREIFYRPKGGSTSTSPSPKKNLPAASELFLSAPLKDPKWKKLNTKREMNDDEGPVYVLANRMFIRQKENDDNNETSINNKNNNINKVMSKKVKFQRYYD